jgi:hypothetical protein
MKWLLLLGIVALAACQDEAPRKVSEGFIFKSREVISQHEEVVSYYDINNENLCYLYYYDGALKANLITCVRKNSY